MENPEMVPLRDRLDALSYTQHLDPSSASLAAALLEDLIQLTESHRICKLEADRFDREITAFDSQMEVLRKENCRLVSENNQLHVDVMTAKEREKTQDREHYQASKALECQIAELAYWKTCTAKRLKELEEENGGLKKRLQESLRPHAAAVGSLEMEKSLDSEEQDCRLSKKSIESHDVIDLDIVKSAEIRISRLEQENGSLLKEVEKLKSETDHLAEVTRLKDAEIRRLGNKLEHGPDMEKLQLQQKTDANETVILTLNQQIEYLSEQLTHFEEDMKDKERLENAYKQLRKDHTEREDAYAKELEKNNRIFKQVRHLQKLVATYTLRRSQHCPVRLDDRDEAMAQVMKFMGSMLDSANDVNTEGETREAEIDTEPFIRINNALRTRVCELEELLDTSRNDKENLDTKLAALNKEKSALEQELDKYRSEATSSSACISQLDQSCEDLGKALREKDEENATLASSLRAEGDLREAQECKIAQSLAERRALEDERSRLYGETTRLRANLETAEQEVAVLRDKAKQSHEIILSLEHAATAAKQSEEESSSAMSLLKKQLEDVSSLNEELVVAAEKQKIEEARFRGQVSGLESEKRFLSQSLEAATERAKELNTKLQQSWLETAQSAKLAQQTEDLYSKLKQLTADKADLEATVIDLTNKNSVLTENINDISRDSQDIRNLFDNVQSKNEELELSLTQEKAAVCRANTAFIGLQEENEKLVRANEKANQDAICLKDSLFEFKERTRAQQLESQNAKQTISMLKGELHDQCSQIEKYQSQLRQISTELDTERVEKDALKAQLSDANIRAQQSEKNSTDLIQQTDQLRSQCEASRAYAEESEKSNARLRRDLAEKSKEVELLTNLSLKGDATMQEYMQHLEFLSSSLQAEELKTQQLEEAVREKEADLLKAREDLDKAEHKIKQMDCDKDHLQDELDVKTEELLNEATNLKSLKQRCDAVEQNALTTENCLRDAKENARRLEEAVATTTRVRESLEEDVQKKASELLSITNDFRAVRDDLELMVRENQSLSNQLTAVQESLERLTEHNAESEKKLAHQDQLLRVKESDVEDLRQAYQDVATENRKLVNDLNAFDRQSKDLEANSEHTRKETELLKREYERSQTQISQQMADLQAFERQVDTLSRELRKKEDVLDENGRQKAILMEEVQCLERQRFQHENEVKECRRQLAQCESALDGSKARVEDCEQEVLDFKNRLRFSQDKIKELEIVIVDLRSRNYNKETAESEEKVSTRTTLQEERIQLLESQIGALENQLAYVEHARDFANDELKRLNEENSRLQSMLASREQAQSNREGSNPELQKGKFPNQVAELHAKAALLMQENSVLSERLSAATRQKEKAMDTVTELRREVESLRALHSRHQHRHHGTMSDSPSGGDSDLADLNEMSTKVQKLERQLEEERRRRNKAEKDFRRLVDITRDLASSPDNSNSHA